MNRVTIVGDFNEAQGRSQLASACSADRGPDLPYRLCVGVMLLRADRRIWIGRRQPKWINDKSSYIWQMPQGGINSDEPASDAARRELREETGVTRVEILAEIPRWITYDLPDELIGIALKGRFRGQRQRWFAMRFLGDDSEISTLPQGGLKPEFDAWNWATPAEVLQLAFPFRRPTYETILREFAALLQ